MNPFNDYTRLNLNGRPLKGQEIIEFCEAQKNPALLPVAEFIKEWLQPDLYIQLKTSGSTGMPKTFQASKDKMLFSASLTADYFGFEAGQTALLCLPTDHIAGKMMIVRALLSQLNLICVKPSKNPLNDLPADSLIDFAAMIPMQLEACLKSPILSQIKKILLGGGPVTEKLQEQIQNIVPQIFLGYGMTETLSHIALRRINGEMPSASYKALEGIELDKDGRNCLTITAPKLLEETLITNDLIEFTGKNEFIWKGRVDNVINSAGIKLIPEELEKKIHPIPQRRFFMAGKKDEKLGEKLILIIEGNPFGETEMSSFKNALKASLGKYEMPKEIYFLDQFIETKNKKLNRSATVEKLNESLSDPGNEN
jgi:O-succinylbenzoic acid--CoA ligase